MLFSRRLALVAALSGVAWLASGCNKPGADTSSAASAPASAPASAAPASAAQPRTVVVGTDPTYAPFEFQNEKGEIVGFDIDVLRAVAQKAGLTLRFVSTPWEGGINALAQGDRDVLISAITITEERKQTLAFTAPYFEATQLIAVPEASKVATLEDLRKRKVGVQTATTGEEIVVKLQGKTSANIKRFESTPLALAELAAGGVEAVVADNGVIAHYLTNNPQAKFKSIKDAGFAPEFYGIAVRKADTALLEQLNQGLLAIQADGSYQKIYAQYFKDAQ
jgi:polar amino acid transport system substrate-binding protein